MPSYSYDHIHLRTRDPRGTAEWYQRMFGARIVESVQSDGQPRLDLDINGLTVFIAPVPADADMAAAPKDPHLGVRPKSQKLSQTAAELRSIDRPRGAAIDTIGGFSAAPLGLDHFGLRVDNLDAAAAELKQRGVTFTSEPHTIRPGVKIAFVQCPDNVRVELLERA